jgi:hypothetical protein
MNGSGRICGYLLRKARSRPKAASQINPDE